MRNEIENKNLKLWKNTTYLLLNLKLETTLATGTGTVCVVQHSASADEGFFLTTTGTALHYVASEMFRIITASVKLYEDGWEVG